MVKTKPRIHKMMPNTSQKIANENSKIPGRMENQSDIYQLSETIPMQCAFFIFASSFFIYLCTMFHSLPGGDSGELMVTASEFGSAHPPGYPLFTILAKIMITVIPYSSVAFRVNLLSCLAGSITNTLLGMCLMDISNNPIVALTISGMFGFSRIFWIWNITGEVFPLNNMLCMALLYNLNLFCKEKKTDEKLKLATSLSFLSGLALTNQHTAILLVVPVALLVVHDLISENVLTKRKFTQLTLSGVAPMFLYLQLPIASYLRVARVSWGDQSTVDGFLFHFLRRDYGTFQLMKNDAAVDFWWNLGILGDVMLREFTIPLVLTALLGAISLIWQTTARKFTSFLLMSLAVYVVFFCTLANVADSNGLYKGVLERFWLQPSLYLAVLAGIGLNEILNRTRLTDRMRVMLPLMVLLLALRIHSNYESCNQRNNAHVEKFGRHILSHLPSNSILLTSGDLSTNTFRYLTIAEGVRPDVHVLDLSFMGSQWYIPIVGEHMVGVKFPGKGYMAQGRQDRRLYNLEMFLDANMATRPVFVCLKPREVDLSSVKKYEPLPYSFCRKFVRQGTVDPLSYGSKMPVPDLDTYLPPRTELYGEQTWEHVVLHEFWEALVKPGRYLWQAGEVARSMTRKKELYTAAYKYLLQAKEKISEKIDSGLISPLSWNHTSYYSKYMGVQCRQLWSHTTDRVLSPGSAADKYYKCQREHFTDYINSADNTTREHDKDFQNIVMLLQNPGM